MKPSSLPSFGSPRTSSDKRKLPRLPRWIPSDSDEEEDDEVMPPSPPYMDEEEEDEEEEDDDEEELAPETRALRRSLLSLIRIHYIEAIRRLPAADIRAALARGVLVGGHCYGAGNHSLARNTRSHS
uniref:Uncharacterized protein n=1 Tax=Oryza meridionalis TaxID=40149 RepID=A0A0E0FD83_9ORYZ